MSQVCRKLNKRDQLNTYVKFIYIFGDMALPKSLDRVNPSPARHRHVDNPAAAQSWPVAFPVQKRTVAGTATCWVAKCLSRPVPVSVFF